MLCTGNLWLTVQCSLDDTEFHSPTPETAIAKTRIVWETVVMVTTRRSQSQSQMQTKILLHTIRLAHTALLVADLYLRMRGWTAVQPAPL